MRLPIQPLQLLKGDEGDDGRRRSTDQRRCQSSEHPCWSFVLEQLSEHDRHAVAGPPRHDASLENVKRAADEGGEEASQTAGSDVCRWCIFHSGALHELPLQHIVAGKLCSSGHGCSTSSDPDTGPDADPSFSTDHAHHTMSNVSVVSA